jgi:hypothetical protein
MAFAGSFDSVVFRSNGIKHTVKYKTCQDETEASD